MDQYEMDLSNRTDEQVELDVLSSARGIGSENMRSGKNIISIALPESQMILNGRNGARESSSQGDGQGPEIPIYTKPLVNDFKMELKIKQTVDDLWGEYTRNGVNALDSEPAEKLTGKVLEQLGKSVPSTSVFENEFHKFSYLEHGDGSEQDSGKNGLLATKAQIITLIYKFANSQN